MRKVLVSIAALGAALSAAPSLAQSWGNGGYGQPGYGYGDSRYAAPGPWQVREMVERAIQRGEVSRGEARDLRDGVRDLFRLEQRTRYGNDWRARERLQRKTFEVLRELREARRDGDGRWGRDRDDDYRYR
ncbi:MAG: hypothetical protein JSR79_08920 [Proteobacteria bacterium]|nr:hypothetical protein [Pseudomonadota bacterium]